uniref:Si:ch211-59d15.9 n=1 Tax=Neogobius melanostomus TaxID=47308 RepID=A0A8C6ST32_9GOBI
MAQSTEERTEEKTQEEPTVVQNEPEQERSDWLLDTALGRWLSSRLAFTNLTLLKILLWLVLLGLFAELEFGLPFFVLSLFYWIYEGLRSSEDRQPGELSAYSVFNPDCQPLLGSLTAEQLEGEMGYRPLANR